MTVSSYLLVFLGLALVAFSAWQRLGRSPSARLWGKAPGRRAVRNALFLYPSLGVLLLVFGLFPMIRNLDWLSIPLSLIAVLALAVFFWWGVLAMPYPRFLVPRWARDLVSRRKGDL